MNFFSKYAFAGVLATITSMGLLDAATLSNFEQSKPIKIALVNFKTCVEKSKLGKQEQSQFDALKKQMETVLLDKEKVLNDMAAKFNDLDYLDSISPEAETELKRKFRALSQEYTQQQNQYYQTLSQANVKIVQKISDEITKAAAEVAKKNNIDLIVNEESSFYQNPNIDVSDLVIAAMDITFENEQKNNKEIKVGSPIP